MRIVTIIRDMRPFRAGQDAVLPDEMAEKLLKSGEAMNSRPFPPADVAPSRPVGTLSLPKGRYLTRKRG